MQQSASAPSQSPLLTAPVGLMIRKIGIPVSVGSFFNTMYNVVDTFYGGSISDQALAALSLSFPIYFFLIAVGFGFGQGSTALIGNSLGRGDQEQAQKRSVQTLTFGILASILLTALVVSISPFLVRMMGATDPDYQQMALSYINPLFYGAVFFIVNLMTRSILNSLGITKPGRNMLIAGFFLNFLLNPWFIFGWFGFPAMGISGIAVATVTIQALGCVYLMYELLKTELLSAELIRKYWKPDIPTFKRIIEQGFPNMLDMLGVSLGFFILTVYVSRFGQNAVAAMGAASRLEQIALLPLLGINIAVVSLVARSNGAGLYQRIQDTYRTSLIYGSGVMLVTMILIAIFARPLMSIFTSEPEIINIGTEYVWIRSLGLIPSAFFFMSGSALRGIERPIWPLILNLLRFAGLPWILILIFVVQLGYGLTTIWIIATASFFIAAVIITVMTLRMLPKPEQAVARG